MKMLKTCGKVHNKQHQEATSIMTDEEKTNGEKQPRKRGQRKGKPHRRGSGSVFRRPERKGGKEWVAQIILENGKTRQRYFYTQAEADEALTEML
jgi:hypothetical protein